MQPPPQVTINADTTTPEHIDKDVPLPDGGQITVNYGDPSWPVSNAGQVALGTLLTVLLTYLSYFIKGWRNLNIEGSVKALLSAITIGASLLALKGNFSLQALITLAPQLMVLGTLLYGLFKKAGAGSKVVAEKVNPT